jgi:hypothetical protein
MGTAPAARHSTSYSDSKSLARIISGSLRITDDYGDDLQLTSNQRMLIIGLDSVLSVAVIWAPSATGAAAETHIERRLHDLRLSLNCLTV